MLALKTKQIKKKKTESKVGARAYLNQRIGNLVVHLLSGLINEVSPIKGELFGRLVHCPGLFYEALAAVRVDGENRVRAESLLPVIQGPAPHNHLH